MNRLSREKSPYLLQHQNNPVDWYPWGEEAFNKAKAADKPIFLSIGYSTCHWCHVMEHESFEDAEVAKALNNTFICIKVDREERPDIDHIYMSICQMMTGSGGWPLTVLLTPDQIPFFSGTYFPKESRHGRLGMLDLINRVVEGWKSQRSEINQSADEILAALKETPNSAGELNESLLKTAFESFKENFDLEWGGFGREPKFPSPHNLMLLMRLGRRFKDSHGIGMVETTLAFQREGGLFDQLGFGFHRYSVDRQWLVPHFEKMLYDQALLAFAYLEAYQISERAPYAQTAREIFEYVSRDLWNPVGAFDSAEDADSEGEEGRFYVWSWQQLRSVLTPAEFELATKYWNIGENGNFSDMGHSSPNNILHISPRTFSEKPPDGIEEVRQKLLRYRGLRVRPHRDDKVLADWNGLMIAAFAKGAQVLNETKFLKVAEDAFKFITLKLMTPSGRLLHRYRDGEAGIGALLDDYAFLAWASLELYQASLKSEYLSWAIKLSEEMVRSFEDESDGGLFFTPKDGEKLIVRKKEHFDGAIPSGNSVAYWVFQRLARMTGQSDWQRRADRIQQALGGQIRQYPTSHSFFLLGLDFALGPTQELVLVGPLEQVRAASKKLHRKFLPNCSVLYKTGQETEALAPFTKSIPLTDSLTYYLCRDFQCEKPLYDLVDVLRSLTS